MRPNAELPILRPSKWQSLRMEGGSTGVGAVQAFLQNLPPVGGWPKARCPLAAEGDADFEANSRRIRLEALANYCRSVVRLIKSGIGRVETLIVKPPT